MSATSNASSRKWLQEAICRLDLGTLEHVRLTENTPGKDGERGVKIPEFCSAPQRPPQTLRDYCRNYQVSLPKAMGFVVTRRPPNATNALLCLAGMHEISPTLNKPVKISRCLTRPFDRVRRPTSANHSGLSSDSGESAERLSGAGGAAGNEQQFKRRASLCRSLPQLRQSRVEYPRRHGLFHHPWECPSQPSRRLAPTINSSTVTLSSFS